jgi:hypothetical protein
MRAPPFDEALIEAPSVTPVGHDLQDHPDDEHGQSDLRAAGLPEAVLDRRQLEILLSRLFGVVRLAELKRLVLVDEQAASEHGRPGEGEEETGDVHPRHGLSVEVGHDSALPRQRRHHRHQ